MNSNSESFLYRAIQFTKHFIYIILLGFEKSHTEEVKCIYSFSLESPQISLTAHHNNPVSGKADNIICPSQMMKLRLLTVRFISFPYSLSKSTLAIYFVSGVVLDTRDKRINKTNISMTSCFFFSEEHRH